MELIKINNTEIQSIEYQSQRVVTFKMIDELHERPEGTAGRNFWKNKERFEKNKDYFEINQADEIRRLGLERKQGGIPEKIYLITERGYLKIVKSLNDKLSWKVQDMLIDCYFKIKEIAKDFNEKNLNSDNLLVKLVEQNNKIVEQNNQLLELLTKKISNPISKEYPKSPIKETSTISNEIYRLVADFATSTIKTNEKYNKNELYNTFCETHNIKSLTKNKFTLLLKTFAKKQNLKISLLSGTNNKTKYYLFS